jgi:multidrug efflux pump subunit AcrA (membrane-fusion protein)
MKRAKRRWRWIAAIVILVAVAATAGLFVLRSGKSRAVRYLTATAATGSIAKTVEADFTLSNARASTTISLGGTSSTASASSTATTSSTSSSSSTSSTSSSSVVTGLALAAGQTPRTLERLLTVSGRPIYAFVSSAPLYESLSTSLASGKDSTNVAALQRALKAGGYYNGTVNGDFGTTTKTALEAWQAAKGLSETGTITTSQFVWVPSGGVLSAWSVGLGSGVSSGTSLATVLFPRPLEATASVSQADISALKVGQKAELTVSSTTSMSFVGTIAAIDSQPTSSSSSASSTSSTSTVDYTVTFRLASVPAAVKSGMSGTLVVTIAKRSNVLVVPTSALTGASYVRVMTHGKPVYRQVATGMATSSYTQITSGLTAGEVVMTGTYSSASTTTSSTSTSNSSRSLLNSLTGGSGSGGGLPTGGAAPPSGGGQ